MQRETVFYDGNCGFCKRVVWSLIMADEAGAFEYAPLRGEWFDQLIDADRRASLPDSVLVLRADGEILAHSTAVAYILARLGRGARLLAGLIRLFPRPVRDWGYHLVAISRPVLSRLARPTDFDDLPADRREQVRT